MTNYLQRAGMGAGEPADVDENDELFQSKLDARGVQEIVRRMQGAVPELRSGWDPIQVLVMRQNMRKRRATMWYDRSNPRIRVYPMGMNEKTMLHELAHFCAGEGAKHGPVFSMWFRKLVEIWRPMREAQPLPKPSPLSSAAAWTQHVDRVAASSRGWDVKKPEPASPQPEMMKKSIANSFLSGPIVWNFEKMSEADRRKMLMLAGEL